MPYNLLEATSQQLLKMDIKKTSSIKISIAIIGILTSLFIAGRFSSFIAFYGFFLGLLLAFILGLNSTFGIIKFIRNQERNTYSIEILILHVIFLILSGLILIKGYSLIYHAHMGM